jgi:hypothetical protein
VSERARFAGTSSRKVGAVVSTCLKCARTIPRGRSYCDACRPDRSGSPAARGNGTTRRQFRYAVLDAAGFRCQAVVKGVRCPVTDVRGLEAHHRRALADGGSNDPSNGVCLCHAHHLLISRKAA